MAITPPMQIFLLVWKNPYRVSVAADFSDWGDSNVPPSHYLRYHLADYGDVTVEDFTSMPNKDSMDSQAKRKPDGDGGPTLV